ncbi:restriction endonuclease subunit S [Schaalia hyovaginalis]|uniref:restriction endonuclease subunit S n=1 Tax=Schaalia hyovaginalis TaxID=29316 RepID=UPI0026E9240D|nr:restriction endonuclease subunit S [Schaalia hyovaginalis]MCI6557754.1 restriction endonuclease subunit S [Schaalia hyovaginalis]MDD7553819.1 restriction endonuclease subunit S [Schaalia hyovaginalis]
MNRIERMVAEMCPDGVEYWALDAVFLLRNGYTPAKSNGEFWCSNEVPWFRMEDIRANGHILYEAIQGVSTSAIKGNLFPADSVLIATSATVGEHALIRVPHMSNQRFTNLSLRREFVGRLDMEFFNYYAFILDKWCLEHVNVSSFASVDMKALRKTLIPVPPIEIQRKIVDILDSFTRLEAELEAELEARRTQYAFYRDRLLSFDFEAGGGAVLQGISLSNVAWVPMGEVGTLKRGRRFTANDFRDEGLAAIHYGEIYTRYGVVAREVGTRVSPNLGELRFAEPGDIIIACVGETVEDIGRGVAWLGSESVAYHDDSVAWRSDHEPRYLSHFLRSRAFDSQKRKFVSSGKVKRIAPAALSQISVPIPPLEVQRRIADVLDDFDALVNDLSSGLPAEIAARRQQYEYYRDRLLTFPEKK